MTRRDPPPPPHDPRTPRDRAEISLSEVLSALSYALDLTEGQTPGHTIRACIIGMRLGREIGLGDDELTALYFALLMKDAGCSSNAARMAGLFGTDDQSVKYHMKFVDWHRRAWLAIRTAQQCGVGRPWNERLAHFLAIARTPGMTREIIEIRCERGADIARGLGFPAATSNAIRSLDEHWCGLGQPQGIRGEEIPLLARIASLAQTMEVFFARHGTHGALRVARKRSGRWFDPALVGQVRMWKRDRDWWDRLARADEIGPAVVALEPGTQARQIDEAGMDEVARAFADIVDAKSPYTYRHSANVAAYAAGIASELGMTPGEQRRLHRAGLLHDIGKLGVSNRILDKPGRLSAEERTAVERHPRYTWEILSRVPAFAGFARLAAVHHEKLDGSGYPWGIRGEDLDRESRILAVADIYEALSADRPYRQGLPRDRVLAILAEERGTKLDAEAIDGLAAFSSREPARDTGTPDS